MHETHKPAATTPGDPPNSYSTLEAAKLLGTSAQTVQRWMDLGHLGGWRTPGGHRRINPASVDRLLRLATLPTPTRANSSGAGASVSIMLVDDSPDDLEFLEAVVRKVVPAANLIDEAALLRALDGGRLAGCAIDVGRAPDQMPTPALARHPKVIATPHLAGLTPAAIEHQALETVAQAAEILQGRAPVGAVNAAAATRLARLRA